VARPANGVRNLFGSGPGGEWGTWLCLGDVIYRTVGYKAVINSEGKQGIV